MGHVCRSVRTAPHGARRTARTARRGTAPHRTAPHRTVAHPTAQHGTARHSTVAHGTARHGTRRHGTAQRRTAPHRTAWRSCDYDEVMTLAGQTPATGGSGRGRSGRFVAHAPTKAGKSREKGGKKVVAVRSADIVTCY